MAQAQTLNFATRTGPAVSLELGTEIAGTEIEARGSFNSGNRLKTNARIIFDLLNKSPDWEIVNPTFFKCESQVFKFKSANVGFSILIWEDGTITVKQKGQKTWCNNIVQRPEKKVNFQPGEHSPKKLKISDLQTLGLKTLQLPEGCVKFGGRFVRRKHTIAARSKKTGRVYSVTLDRSQYKGQKYSRLYQFEIEYKGIIKTAKLDSVNPKKTIADEVKELYRVLESEKKLHLKPSRATKCGWLTKLRSLEK